ncbi:MAG: hypothetical protein QGI12_05135 [Acidimicrobiales bacterium]|jgi:CDP-diglyceride synthetase|nr:hypothetical protein [Acidimicrobiales bacterium]
MNTLASFRGTHEVIEWLMVLLNASAGIWSLQAHRNKLFRVPALAWLTAIAQIMVLVHLFSGVAVASSENIEVPKFHLLYWSAAALSVGVIYGYRNQLENRRYLLYGFAGLFLMGLGIRSMILGPI